MPLIRRAVLCFAPTLVVLAVVASPAVAHIDPDPAEAPAGSEQSVGFTVQHGCDGSSTVELRMRLPDGVDRATPEPPAGWTGVVEGNVVTFTGGPLADDVEETFRVRMVLPVTPDVTIYFPFVQRCAVGEIAWIDIPADGSGTELDEPAPAMTLTAALPGTTEVPPTTIEATTTTAAVTTTTTTSSPATTQPATTEPATESTAAGSPSPPAATSTPATADTVTTALATTPVDADGDDDSDSGRGGTIVLIVAIVVVLAAGAAVLFRARRSQ